MKRGLFDMPRSWWITGLAQLVFWNIAVASWHLPHWWGYIMIFFWNYCAYTGGQIDERHRQEWITPTLKEPKMREHD